MSRTGKDVVREFHQRLWAQGDLSAIDEFVAPDALTHVTGFSGSSRAVIHEDVERYQNGFTDVRPEILALLEEGDQVAMWWATTGRHTGPYGTIAPQPTGRDITMRGVNLHRIAGGVIVEIRSFWDAADVYRQFDLLAEGL